MQPATTSRATARASRKENRPTRWLLTATVLLIAAAAPCQPGLAQEPPTLDELRRMVTEQQALLEEQRGQIEAQARRLAEQEEMLRSLAAQLDQVQRSEQRQAEQLAQVTELARGLEPEAFGENRQENETVAGEFPGSIPIPGTDMAVRPGGFVNMSVVANTDNLEVNDRFVTAFIPVGETVEGQDGATVSARRSRLNLDWRTGSTVGEFRAFVEGDFLGDSNTFRLRHAFGQFKGATYGQTWSTFIDPDSSPEEIDLEGINGEVVLRQPLVRYEKRWRKGKLAVAIEDPGIEIRNGVSRSQLWDTVVRIARREEDFNFHLSAVIRQIRAQGLDEDDPLQTEFGWGLSTGGRISTPRWDERDRFLFQATLGEGVAHYLTDLRAEGELDGVIDPETGELTTPFVYGGYVSYQHWWPFEWRNWRSLRSSATLGMVWVSSPELALDDTYRRTTRFSINTLWSPIEALDVGLEYLWGRRQNRNGEFGTASQFQLATYFRF